MHIPSANILTTMANIEIDKKNSNVNAHAYHCYTNKYLKFTKAISQLKIKRNTKKHPSQRMREFSL